MKALIPVGFDLTKHQAAYPPAEYGLSAFDQDHALYILSQISLIPLRNQDLEDEKDGFVPLSSVALQKEVRHYNEYLTYFVNTGVLETNGTYRPGVFFDGKGKCRGYRFAALHTPLDGELASINYSVEYTRKQRVRIQKERRALTKEYGHLTRWLLPGGGLKIDAREAINYLKAKRQAQINKPNLCDAHTDPIYGTRLIKNPNLQYQHARARVDRIATEDISCTVDDTAGRMHTPLTNMQSELRHFLTHAGEELVSVDLTNSQPYLSTLLFSPGLYRTKGKQLKLSHINPQIYREITHSTLMLVKQGELSTSEDFKLYKSLVGAEGKPGCDLYSYLQGKGATPGATPLTRNEAKTGFFEVSFSKNTRGKKSKVWLLFKNSFPSVEILFRQLKEGDHSLLARLLQSIEAHIMLKVITKAIAKKDPTIPLFTIHDSIVTTAKYAEVVKETMEKMFTDLIGLKPMLKVERWHPSKIDWEKYELTPPGTA